MPTDPLPDREAVQGPGHLPDQYCVDILKQTYAVRRAIEKMEGILLAGHLQTCAVEGIKDGREAEIVAELKELYILANK